MMGRFAAGLEQTLPVVDSGLERNVWTQRSDV